tara:strand:+ start:288 stop:392 length:105 start_codon:yes stop_codon:yes gene_type:complete
MSERYHKIKTGTITRLGAKIEGQKRGPEKRSDDG